MDSRFVVDNSVVMSWCFLDEAGKYTDAVLNCLSHAEALVPSLWPLEVVNVLLVAERKNRISPAAGAAFIALLGELPITVENNTNDPLMSRILHLGRETNLSSYDASYLDLAIRNSVPIATVDKKLIAAARAVGVKILKP
jgi:predicted nucleic acid-binding protein